MKQWQKYLAELFGTFTLVAIGTTAVLAALRLSQGDSGAVELIAPFAFGLALLGGLYAFGEVSGGHFNPAVSLAMYLDRRLSAADLVGYWVAQFAGAILASAVLLLPFTDNDVANTATVPTVGDGAAFALEAITTAVFVVVILQATRSTSYRSSALVAIPLTLVAIHFATIPFTGTSVNPARTLGPALVGNRWDSEWVYFLGPAVGAVIAWLVHTVVVRGDINLRDDLDRVKEDATGGSAS